jgi:hypothetical protein
MTDLSIKEILLLYPAKRNTFTVMLWEFLTSTPTGFACDDGTVYPAGGLIVIV